MNIQEIKLQNFRCFQDIAVEFHKSLNIIVGINGTGKTALLEALRIAIGSLFLGVDKYKDKIASPSITQDDVRLKDLEQQYPVIITASGEISEFDSSSNLFQNLTWERSL